MKLLNSAAETAKAKCSLLQDKLLHSNNRYFALIQNLDTRRLIEEFEKKNLLRYSKSELKSEVVAVISEGNQLNLKSKLSSITISRRDIWNRALENDLKSGGLEMPMLRERLSLISTKSNLGEAVARMHNNNSAFIHKFPLSDILLIDKSKLYVSEVIENFSSDLVPDCECFCDALFMQVLLFLILSPPTHPYTLD